MITGDSLVPVEFAGVNNVALWIGEKASKYIPFINIAPWRD